MTSQRCARSGMTTRLEIVEGKARCDWCKVSFEAEPAPGIGKLKVVTIPEHHVPERKPDDIRKVCPECQQVMSYAGRIPNRTRWFCYDCETEIIEADCSGCGVVVETQPKKWPEGWRRERCSICAAKA